MRTSTPVEHAIELSRAQFGWLADPDSYEALRRDCREPRALFFRIDPVEALLNDYRLPLQWRTLLCFARGRRARHGPHAVRGECRAGRLRMTA